MQGKTQRRYPKTPLIASLVAVAATGLGALVAAAGPATANTASVKAAALVKVDMAKVSKYGNILVDQAGYALYYDTANKPGKWACTGKCLGAWPPLTLPKGQAAAVAGAGVSGLGTVKNPSGRQVTWDGKALYTFIRDSKGTVEGQGIGKVWYVARVTATAASGMTTTTSAGASPTTTSAGASPTTTAPAAPTTTAPKSSWA